MNAAYVIVVSAPTREALVGTAQDLAAFVARSASAAPRDAGFTRDLTPASVARTLATARDASTHRLAFVAGTLAEIADKLTKFADDPEARRALARQGVHYATTAASALDGSGQDAEDRAYVAQLAEAGKLDQIAKLWVMGFAIDWTSVHGWAANDAPVYLPVSRIPRQRYWPAAAAAVVAPARSEPILPPAAAIAEAPPSVRSAGQEPLHVVPAAPKKPRANGASAPRASAEASDIRALAPAPMWSAWKDLPVPIRRQRVRTYLQERIAAVLGLAAGELPAIDTGFFDLGMTSVHLARVRADIIRDLGFEPSDTSAFDHPTISEYAQYILDAHRPRAAAAPPTKAKPAASRRIDALNVEAIEKLSLGELEDVLEQIA